jgi:hypothetical protein
VVVGLGTGTNLNAKSPAGSQRSTLSFVIVTSFGLSAVALFGGDIAFDAIVLGAVVFVATGAVPGVIGFEVMGD